MPALSVLVLLFVADGLSLRPGDHARSLEVAGQRRGYLVHVPPQYDPATPTPVVLAFHGGGGKADAMAAFSGLNEKADQAGFIVAYPDGSGRLERMRTFNAGHRGQRPDVGVFREAPHAGHAMTFCLGPRRP